MSQSSHRHSDASRESLKDQSDAQTFKISESPLFPLNTEEIFGVAQTLFKSALPISLTYISSVMTGLISLRFAGKYGSAEELAGASLGYTWASVFCIGLFLSIDQGFAIIASRLFGAEKYRELGVLYQRNVCVIAALCVPMILPMLFADNILMSLGLHEDVSVNTAIFLKSMIPSIIGTFLFSSTKYFLISQNIFNIQSIILGCLVPLHVFWCYIFVDIFGMPVAGAGLAKSVTDVSAAIILFLYIRYAGICQETWIPWTKECLENWGFHLKQTLMLGATTYVEWIAYEISMFIIGALNTPAVLGAHGVAVNFTTAIFYIPLGVSLSIQTYIGNAIGEGYSKNKVQKIMAGGLALNAVITVFSVITMVTFNKQIAMFFIADETSRQALQNMLMIYSVAHIFDSYANCLGGVLRVVGKEKEVLTAFLICYLALGVNGQWIFGLLLGYGYIAIWICTAGAIIVMCGVTIHKVYTLNWSEELEKVKRLLDEETYAETQDYIELVEM